MLPNLRIRDTNAQIHSPCLTYHVFTASAFTGRPPSKAVNIMVIVALYIQKQTCRGLLMSLVDGLVILGGLVSLLYICPFAALESP